MTSYLTVGDTTWLPMDELSHVRDSAERCQAWWLSAGPTWISTVRVGRKWYRKLWDRREIVEETIERILALSRRPSVSSWGSVWRSVGVIVPPPPAHTTTDKRIRSILARGDWPYPFAFTEPGAYIGTWNEWDIKSAYPWASSLGLPCPWRLREIPRDSHPSSKRIRGRSNTRRFLRRAYLLRGWRQSSSEPERRLVPFWARENTDERDRILFQEDAPARLHWLYSEDFEALGIHFSSRDCAAIIEWGDIIDPRPAFDRVEAAFPAHISKNILAAHWGAWAMGSGTESGMFEKGKAVNTWKCASAANPLLSGILQSRVSCRVSDYAADSPRTYVDSVFLPRGYTPNPSGNTRGEWRLKATFHNGLLVKDHPLRPCDLTEEKQPGRRYKLYSNTPLGAAERNTRRRSIFRNNINVEE